MRTGREEDLPGLARTSLTEEEGAAYPSRWTASVRAGRTQRTDLVQLSTEGAEMAQL